MANFVPQGFLNGLRAASSNMGMGDTRNTDQRSADQWMGFSGNPSLVYNQPQQPNISPLEMMAQQQAAQQRALPTYQTNPGNMPQRAPVALPSWESMQRMRMPVAGQRAVAPDQQFPAARFPMLQRVQGGPSQQVASMPVQRRQLPIMDNFDDQRRPNPFAQYMAR